MKTCNICNILKELKEFHLHRQQEDGHDRRCKECRKKLARADYMRDPFVTLARLKKSECKKKGFDYNLDSDYLREIWTGICPITKQELTIGNKGAGSHKSAHLDRMNSKLGYVKGNVCYINGRSNRIKYNATVEELKQILNWMEGATTIPKGSTPKQVEAPCP